MPKGVKLTENLYTQIKQATDRGAKDRSIAETFGVCERSVNIIRHSSNYKDYCDRQYKKAYGQSKESMISVKRATDYDSYTKESEIMDIIKKQADTNETALQQILWMARTIGVTIGAIYDIVRSNCAMQERSHTNQTAERNLIIKNQQEQNELLERMVEQWKA